MKKIRILLFGTAIMLCGSVYAQHQHIPVKNLLEDKNMQDSIMTAIVNDHQMMMNMMQHMKQNRSAMHMMMEDKEMMKQMINAAGKDSSMCRMMMDTMEKNKMRRNNMKDGLQNKRHNNHH